MDTANELANEMMVKLHPDKDRAQFDPITILTLISIILSAIRLAMDCGWLPKVIYREATRPRRRTRKRLTEMIIAEFESKGIAYTRREVEEAVEDICRKVSFSQVVGLTLQAGAKE